MTRQDWAAYRALCKVFAYYLHEGELNLAALYLDGIHSILTAHATFREELIETLKSELRSAFEEAKK